MSAQREVSVDSDDDDDGPELNDRSGPFSTASTTSGEQRAVEERRHKEDRLGPFRQSDGSMRKMPKDEREGLIRQQFPSVQSMNWETALHNDLDLFARIMRDIIKLDQQTPGKSGPRPMHMDYELGVASFRQLMGQDYSTLPFTEAFGLLARPFSITQVARKVSLSRSRTHRLMQGKDKPSQGDMALIAKGFNKHASYFVEYRRAFIIDQLASRLLDAPETTITYYTKLRGG